MHKTIADRYKTLFILSFKRQHWNKNPRLLSHILLHLFWSDCIHLVIKRILYFNHKVWGQA